MRKDFGVQPIIYPMPVLIIAAYDKDGGACAMNAAWGSISSADKVSMCLTPSHKTVKNILETKAFTVSLADQAHMAEADYLGIASGNDVEDKIGRAGLHMTKSSHVNAPLIDEFPIALECELLSYDVDSHIMVGKIINVCAEEAVITDGKIDIVKAAPITFDTVGKKYRGVGEVVGNAFSDGEKFKEN